MPKHPPPLIHRRHRNFRALSANVQRLISHSNTSLHPDDMNENQPTDEPNFDSVKKRLSSAQILLPSITTTSTTTTTATTNGSKFKHPLSKNTDKLTQFVSDLVIDDSDGGYVTPPEENLYENHDNPGNNVEILYENRENNLYEDVNLNVHDYEDAEDIEEKTPINECEAFNFDRIQDQMNGNEDDDVYDIVEQDPNWDTHVNNKVDVSVVGDETRTSLKNTSFVHSILNKSETILNGSSQNGSAQNSPTLSQKSTDSTDTTKTTTTPPTSTSTPTKSQLFAIKAQLIEQSAKHSPVSNSSADLSINENEKVTNLNEKTNAISTHEKPTVATHKENGQITIDLKRTKIRPLSSVSISSTSSSSSSASDEHSSNQNAISYLASVESLADHSENELAILSSSLTVTERACLEIIDSERSYVNDLGQVIRG